MLFCGFGFCLRKSAESAGDIGVSYMGIDWVSLHVILPQIAQITQRNAASCIISQTKTGCLRLRLFFVLWFIVWGLSAIICGISGRHWGFFCVDWLSTLACYSPADSADHAETNAASCIISQRKTGCLRLRLFFVLWFIVWGLSAIICGICERYWGSRALSTK